MTGQEIKRLRDKLQLTQVQLAQLLGVHPLTVSKWERNIVSPTPHQTALLDSFRQAQAAQRNIGDEVGDLLVAAGVAMALYILLRAALGE